MAGDRECTSNYMLTAKSKFQEGRCWYMTVGIGVGIAMLEICAMLFTVEAGAFLVPEG